MQPYLPKEDVILDPKQKNTVHPPKKNMEPENGPFEKEIPIKNPSFAGFMLNFGGVPIFSYL